MIGRCPRGTARRFALVLPALALALGVAQGDASAQGRARGNAGPGKAAPARPTQARPAEADRAQAQAQGGETASCSVFEIEASNGKPGVDPALRPLARKLKKPPFSSWKTFKLLQKHDKALQKMKQLTLPLVTGAKMGLLYRDKSDAEGKKVRLRLAFTLDDKDGKRKLDGTIKLDSGDYYLIGGDELKGGGTYIVAVSCTAN